MNNIRSILKQYAKIDSLFLMIIFSVYGFIVRERIIEFSTSENKSINQWDILLSFWGDPFLIFYLIVPYWIFCCIKIFFSEHREFIRIRLKTEFKWMSYVFSQIFRLLIKTITIFITISFVLTIHIDYQSIWSSWSLSESYFNSSVSLLAYSGQYPFLLFGLQIVLSSLFLLSLATWLCTFYIIAKKRYIVIIVGTILYLGSIISFKRFPSDWVLFKASSYSILSFSYYDFHSLWIGFVIQVLLIAFGWYIVYAKGIFQISTSSFNRMHLFTFLYILLTFWGILSIGHSNFIFQQNTWNSVYNAFFGVSKSGFRLLNYLFFSFVFLGFVYFVQLRFYELMNGRIYYLLIRYRSLAYGFTRFFLKSAGYAALLIVGLLVLSVGISTIMGQSFDFEQTDLPSTILDFLYHFVVNGFLQLLNYILISIIAIWIWKEAYVGLVVLCIFLIGGLPTMNIGQWLPFALNSMGILGSASENVQHTFVLLAFLIVEIGVILNLCYRKKILF
ncbi:hypothetical protein [Saccharibacillus sp. JS10]|uniref:hypothetical protein n=1 Tax=Saccharibacillus sp. JS10 TaxID=2950552 RepID=UPI00210B300F|nr:hypothetical protein [Saccharibacillus sp. JS10]MCQ4087901.1 hypothetical protein [Saccharibacillus sp. JS10]